MTEKIVPKTAGTPLGATLKRLSTVEAGGLDLSASVGAPGGAGWVPATGLPYDGGLLEEILGGIGRAHGTGNRPFTTTALLRGYLWRVLVPTVAAFLLERRIPDPEAGNLALRFDENGFAEGFAFVGARFAALPDDPDAVHPDAVVLASEEEQLLWLRERLAAGLPDLFAALRRSRPRRSERVLWGVAVDSCAEAFMFVGGALGKQEEACSHAETMLSGKSPLSGTTGYFLLEHASGSELTRTRNVCCLYYKVGDGACFTCPRTTNEERVGRLATT